MGTSSPHLARPLWAKLVRAKIAMTGRLTRRQFLQWSGAGAAGLAAAELLAACGAEGTGGVRKDTLTVGIVQEPTSLDPTADATASIALLLRDNLYEGLVRLSPNGEILPQLATSWQRQDNVYTFHLTPNARWHDGTSFTAEDVKFSFDRAMSPSTKPPNPHAGYWEPVQSVEVVDPHTVRVTLKEYSFNFLFHMGAGSACIVSPRTVATDATNPIGTGPFRFQSWNHGASLTLVRNDAYWGRKARLRKIVFRFITDPTAMNDALVTGGLDAIGQVEGTQQLAALKRNPRFRVLEGQPVGKVIVTMNNASGPLRDARVRRALSRAVNRRTWIEGIWNGYAVPIGSHACPNQGEPYYIDTISINPYDPAQARQLLQAAGYGSGLTLRLAPISDFAYSMQGAEILQSELQEVGVKVVQQPVRFAEWLATVFTGPQDFDLTIVDHVEERDIGNYGNPAYYWHYDNPTLAGWLRQADADSDQSSRDALYAKIQRTIAEDAVNIFVASPDSLAVTAADVRGYPSGAVSPSLYLADTYFV
jgi:peptide/nickel transport system substrate-binding protein